MRKLRWLAAIFLVSFLSACSIFGIHFKIHNPSRAGKYPAKTEARVLLGDQGSKYRTCYDVKYYKLGVTFGDDLLKDKGINGDVQLKAAATVDFDTLQLDLAKHLKITSIYYQSYRDGTGMPALGPSLQYFRKENAVFVVMNGTEKKGNLFGLGISYEGVPEEAKKAPWRGGFVRKKDDLKNPWWGVACQSEGASLWWPCKDVVNDEPDSMIVNLNVPEGLMAVSNGNLVKTYSKVPNRTTFTWRISHPINTYNITFYIGKYKLLHDVYVSPVTHDTLQLNHYVLEQHYDKAKTHFTQLKDHLEFYEETFGPYPWYRDGFKLVESPYAGMEHQSAIAYGNGFKNSPLWGFDYIILHETAHEWWGNSVTAADLADAWIHEGFASYCEALYVEKTQGYDSYMNYLLFQRLTIINRRPVVGEPGIRYFNFRDGDIYMKGSWVLHSLRYAVGNDSLFFDILRSFYMENREKQISSPVFEELVSRKTGKDFTWFFSQYLYERFVPELEYCVRDGKLYYRWNPAYSDPSFDRVAVAYGLKNKDRVSYVQNKLVPSGVVQQADAAGMTGAWFNDKQFLFKPVENRRLSKIFEKQAGADL